MFVDRQHFLDQGYVIIRNLIPPARLDELRKSFEVLVDRQRAIWARDRAPGAPPGGEWETGGQPRLHFDNNVDKSTANTVGFCLGEETLGVSQQLMGAPEAAITGFMLMCNPVRDHGPAAWHRDITAGHPAPLRGMQAIIADYGPQYVQWNIALYDDSVLWVVPGSHKRVNTPEEDRQLAHNAKVPLPGGIPADLRTGDGVAYILPILHWGSHYAPTHRRCIHLGYRAFGTQAFSYVHWRHWNPEFAAHLAPQAQKQIARYEQLWRQEQDMIEAIFRAAIRRDRTAFEAALARLHPGHAHRIVSVVMLSKLAWRIDKYQQIQGPDVAAQRNRLREHWHGSRLLESIADRFTPAEARELWQRFEPLDARLRLPTATVAPGAQDGTSVYEPNEMPAGLDVPSFVAGWTHSG